MERSEYLLEETLNIYDPLNKLFLSFTLPEQLDETISNITKRYSVLYNKIFILESESTSELICTYNIDSGNISEGLLPSTISVHRNKGTNTLYTINALNLLVKSLNGGKADKNFKVNWEEHRNSILLTNSPTELRTLKTKIRQIIET